MKASLFSTLVALAAIAPCFADSETHCCSACGCATLQKSCRAVPDIKKEVQTKWVCECEDICVPGRSIRCGETCVPDCNARGGKRCEILWEPTCAKVLTRKKLKKQTITVEKPGFKYVVETVCTRCGTACTP